MFHEGRDTVGVNNLPEWRQIFYPILRDRRDECNGSGYDTALHEIVYVPIMKGNHISAVSRYPSAEPLEHPYLCSAVAVSTVSHPCFSSSIHCFPSTVVSTPCPYFQSGFGTSVYSSPCVKGGSSEEDMSKISHAEEPVSPLNSRGFKFKRLGAN